MFFIKKKRKEKEAFHFHLAKFSLLLYCDQLVWVLFKKSSSLKIRMIFTCILEVSLMTVKTLILLEFIETHLMFHVDKQLLSFIYWVVPFSPRVLVAPLLYVEVPHLFFVSLFASLTVCLSLHRCHSLNYRMCKIWLEIC